jgi:dTDP-glucose pyrophosphorylase
LKRDDFKLILDVILEGLVTLRVQKFIIVTAREEGKQQKNNESDKAECEVNFKWIDVICS